MSPSPLEEGLSLSQLLEVEGFREVCRSFSELFGIGIKVYDAEAGKIADVRASTGDHCGYLFTVHPTQVACTNLVNRIRTVELSSDSPVQTIDCFSGLRYKIQPLTYEGTLLGRLIFGPYAPAELVAPPAALAQYTAQGLDLERLSGYSRAIPRASDETVAKVIEHITNILAVIVHSSYRTQLTSKVHIASIQGAFEDLEKTNHNLKLANDKLRELDRLKSNFIATVSHELRTPLTSVIGYSEMLLEGMAGDLNNEQREYVTTILEKGESLLTLIGQVLDLSRIESGNVLIHKQPTDPRDLVSLAVSDVTPQATRRDVQLQTEIAEEVSAIVVDGDKVRRVITNLVANAVKFSPENGVVQIRLGVHETQPEDADRFDLFEPERNKHLRIEVSDQGVGIPGDKLDQIFEAFFQVDNSSTREFGGTGLGLSIVRNFVRAHNGQIDVTSSVGDGSTFVVLLPYVSEDLGSGVGAEIMTGQRSA